MCSALPLAMICSATVRTVLIGTAKPMPMLPLSGLLGSSDRIWLVMPITWPSSLISGPPELPWLMAASVWMAPRIWTSPWSEPMSRFRAETMPVVTVRVSPSGFPIATTGSPT